MCGISGWAGSPDRERAERMSGVIRHRGPDERGEYADASATLRHERLSIIDLKGGHQPLSNEDNRYQIIFNGEIYNYSQLRAQLESRGHRFRTTSDTEVIVHLYEDEGERCPERLLGMFAFAIWDTREKTLFLARDRMGIKPLFYAEANGELVFASELKSILASGVVPRCIDPESLDMYLTFMYVPAPRTIVAGINKLMPGQTLTWKDGRARLRTYWELPSAETAAHPPHREAVDELTALLEDAVKIRLMSEVPLGAYLSGGLDSSLVVALMSRASDTPVNTFSVGFEERAFDERQWSRLVAEKFHTRHEELIVRHHSAEELPKIIHALDEPVADSAAIPTYFMAEVTKPHVTVVLAEGALDAWAAPIQMKKSRPGWLLSAIAERDKLDRIENILFRETTTFGVRRYPVERSKLAREFRTVSTEYGDVRVKVGSRQGHVLTISPEYEDCRKLAVEKGVPIRLVIQAAIRAFNP